MERIINGVKINYRHKTSDEDVLNHSFENDIFLRSIPEVVLPDNLIAIDIGAHIGTFSLHLSQKRPNAKVYAIEACKETFEVLKQNVLDNQLGSRIFCHHKALSGKDGQVKLYYSQGNWGHSITKQLSREWENVEAQSLDNFFSNEEMSFCDLIKLNCEGAEFDIIFNARMETLQKIGLMIILYHNDLKNEKLGDENQLIKLLESSGFFCRTLNQRGQRGWIIAKNKKSYNHWIEEVKIFGIRLKKFVQRKYYGINT